MKSGPKMETIFVFMTALVVIMAAGCDNRFRDHLQSTSRSKEKKLPVKLNPPNFPWDPGSPNGPTFETPTRQLAPSEWPELTDDMDFTGLELAIDRQLQRYDEKNLAGRILLGGEEYPLTAARLSLRILRWYAQVMKDCLQTRDRASCYSEFNKGLKERFVVFVPDLKSGDPRYGELQSTLFTGYYTPLLKGKSTPDTLNKYGIFQLPKSRDLAAKTRDEIDFGNALSNRGLELAFVPDLFDLYLLHVEGGGRVEVDDGGGQKRGFYLSYDGTNGKTWKFISTYMVSKGYIDNHSIQTQREYLRNNPDKHREIYSTCPSYVYFKVSATPPLGSDDVPLTDNRSIATDISHYKFKGLLSYVVSKRLSEQGLTVQPYSRFYLDQDTGGAIRGKARADIYFGEGDYAQSAAAYMKERGDLYFFMVKKP